MSLSFDRYESLYWYPPEACDNGRYDDIRSFPNQVWDEIERAVEKHGIQNTPLYDGRVGQDGWNLKVLVEEVGEVARATTYDEGDEGKLKAELIQVAAMAVAWAMSLERGNDVSIRR